MCISGLGSGGNFVRNGLPLSLLVVPNSGSFSRDV